MQYPSYLNQSLLSQAFSHIDCINLRVNYQRYEQELRTYIEKKEYSGTSSLQPLKLGTTNRSGFDEQYEIEDEDLYDGEDDSRLSSYPNLPQQHGGVSYDPLSIKAGLVTG